MRDNSYLSMLFEVCKMSLIVGVVENPVRSSVMDFRHHPEAAMIDGRGVPDFVASKKLPKLWCAALGFQS